MSYWAPVSAEQRAEIKRLAQMATAPSGPVVVAGTRYNTAIEAWARVMSPSLGLRLLAMLEELDAKRGEVTPLRSVDP